MAYFIIVSKGYDLPRGYRMRVERLVGFLKGKAYEVHVLRIKNLPNFLYLYRLAKNSSKQDVFMFENIGISLLGLLLPNCIKVLDYHGSIFDASFRKDFFIRRHIYSFAEMLILKRWKKIMVVSNSFKEHLIEKYGTHYQSKINVVPNIPELPNIVRKPLNPHNVIKVVYVGGTQSWQRVGEMIRWLEDFSKYCKIYEKTIKCTFLTKEVKEFKDLLFDVSFNYRLYSTDITGVYDELNSSNFALLLRNQDEINKVACPTKVVEYILSGIPIITTPGIGDISYLVNKYNQGLVLTEPLNSKNNFKTVMEFKEGGIVPKNYFDRSLYNNLII